MTEIQFDLGFSSRTVASYPLSRRVAIIKSAEALGFDRLWHSNEKFGRDMVANMTLSAAHTERIGIGAAVTDPYSVHPALTAAAMATVDDISSGRVIVGMGAGGSGFPAMGIQRERPVAAMRDAIAIMRAMWSGQPADGGGQGGERPETACWGSPPAPTSASSSPPAARPCSAWPDASPTAP